MASLHIEVTMPTGVPQPVVYNLEIGLSPGNSPLPDCSYTDVQVNQDIRRTDAMPDVCDTTNVTDCLGRHRHFRLSRHAPVPASTMLGVRPECYASLILTHSTKPGRPAMREHHRFIQHVFGGFFKRET